MITTEQDYIESKKRLLDEQQTIDDQLIKLKQTGLTKEQINLAIDPLVSFMMKLKEEIEEYENLRLTLSDRDFDKVINEIENPSLPNNRMKLAFKNSQTQPKK